MTTTNNNRSSGRLSNVVAAFEANIAKSDAYESGSFITNIASGRSRAERRSSTGGGTSSALTQQSSDHRRLSAHASSTIPSSSSSSHRIGRRSSTTGITNTARYQAVEVKGDSLRVGNTTVSRSELLDASSHHESSSGRVRIRVRKANSKEGLDVATCHESVRSARVGFEKTSSGSSQRSTSAPRQRLVGHKLAEEDETNKDSSRAESSNTPSTGRRMSATGSTASKVPLVKRIFEKRGSCGPGASILRRKSDKPEKYAYDYHDTKKTWHKRTKMAKEQADQEHKPEMKIFKRLRKLRPKKAVEEPEIVKKVKRHGSTGKLEGLIKKSKKKEKDKKESKAGDKKSKKKKGKKKPPEEAERKVKRRASTGGAQLADEPLVALYWNPDCGEGPDPKMIAADAEKADNFNPEGPNMYDRGIIQRRASTGRVRMPEEETFWLFAREDHEIADADVRGGKHSKKHKKKKKSKSQKYHASKKDTDSTKSQLRRKKSVAPGLSAKGEDQTDLDDSQHSNEPPKRYVERRGSTGAVPLANEADSRLHRKKKMRQEHKRRKKVNLSRKEGIVPQASAEDQPAEDQPKPSLIGLLDPTAALPDDVDDPTNWLVSGSMDHVFTIATYKPPPPKFRKAQRVLPRELDFDSDSDDESNEDSEDEFAKEFFSTRPGAGRSKSPAKKQKVIEEKVTVDDQSDDDDDFAAQFFSLRPGVTRGKSMMEKGQKDEPPAKIPTSRVEDDTEATSMSSGPLQPLKVEERAPRPEPISPTPPLPPPSEDPDTKEVNTKKKRTPPKTSEKGDIPPKSPQKKPTKKVSPATPVTPKTKTKAKQSTWEITITPGKKAYTPGRTSRKTISGDDGDGSMVSKMAGLPLESSSHPAPTTPKTKPMLKAKAAPSTPKTPKKKSKSSKSKEQEPKSNKFEFKLVSPGGMAYSPRRVGETVSNDKKDEGIVSKIKPPLERPSSSSRVEDKKVQKKKQSKDGDNSSSSSSDSSVASFCEDP